MQPKAIRNHAVLRGADGLLRLEMVDAGREFVLDPLAELIWDLCDGSRNIEALAQAAGRALDRVVHQEEVFAALDFLADAGLIEERVAPPVAEGNVSRRSLLTRIAPVVGAAWMMSGIAAKAGGLIQYSESANKESNNKESNTKAGNREASNKESNTKAGNREVSDKENDGKARNRESDDKQDWNRQQDAEKRRKSDFKKTMDEVNESERQSELREQKMRASWPKVYELVGHKLSEFPELNHSWVDPFIIFAHDASCLSPKHDWTCFGSDWRGIFQHRLSAFGRNVRQSPEALARFTKAGFDLPKNDPYWPPFLAGDSQRKTYLIVDHILDPEIDDNRPRAIDTDNLFFQFYDPEAAYQFLSSRRTTGTQMKK